MPQDLQGRTVCIHPLDFFLPAADRTLAWCPDISTADGILTVIAVGNLFLFHDILVHRPKIPDFTDIVTSEELLALKFIYIQLMGIIVRDYEISIVATWDGPTNAQFSVFHGGILTFSKALIAYAKKEELFGKREEDKGKSKQSSSNEEDADEAADLLAPDVIAGQVITQLNDFWPDQWNDLMPPLPEAGDEDGLDELLNIRIELEDSAIEIVHRESRLAIDEIDFEPFGFRTGVPKRKSTTQEVPHIDLGDTARKRKKIR